MGHGRGQPEVGRRVGPDLVARGRNRRRATVDPGEPSSQALAVTGGRRLAGDTSGEYVGVSSVRQAHADPVSGVGVIDARGQAAIQPCLGSSSPVP